MGKNEVRCEICKQMTDEPHRHHITPKSRGGTHKGTITCCPTCNGQVHVLFTNKELDEMTREELLESPEMVKYIKWKKKHPGDHRHKSSKKVKKWLKGHRG